MQVHKLLGGDFGSERQQLRSKLRVEERLLRIYSTQDDTLLTIAARLGHKRVFRYLLLTVPPGLHPLPHTAAHMPPCAPAVMSDVGD